jgi:hypothetical protein
MGSRAERQKRVTESNRLMEREKVHWLEMETAWVRNGHWRMEQHLLDTNAVKQLS